MQMYEKCTKISKSQMDFLKNLSGSTVSRSAELLADDGYVVHDHDAAGGGTVCVALLAGGEDDCQLLVYGVCDVGIVSGVGDCFREVGSCRNTVLCCYSECHCAL